MANKRWKGDQPSHVGEYDYADNWEPSGVPTAGDHVVIPVGAEDITDGLDQSAVDLASFTVEDQAVVEIGTATEFLQIHTDKLVFRGKGQAYLDLGDSTVNPEIYSTVSPTTGGVGLNIIGSAIGTLSVMGGTVGVAFAFGEVATVTNIRSIGSGSTIVVGRGVTLTTALVNSGSVTIWCACTTVNAHGGTVTTMGTGTITTLNTDGGTIVANSTGTVTNCVIDGGTVDFLQNGSPRTVTNMTVYPAPDSGSTLKYDSAILTVTNWNHAGDPLVLTAVRA